MDIVGCPHCGTGNRLGKAFCKKCMRPIPQVEDIIKSKPKKQIFKKPIEVEKDEISILSKEDKNEVED